MQTTTAKAVATTITTIDRRKFVLRPIRGSCGHCHKPFLFSDSDLFKDGSCPACKRGVALIRPAGIVEQTVEGLTPAVKFCAGTIGVLLVIFYGMMIFEHFFSNLGRMLGLRN